MTNHDFYIDLHYSLHDVSEDTKLLLIKKLPFMTKEYARFLAGSLIDSQVASDITFSRNVQIDVNGSPVTALGLILYNAATQEYTLGYLLSSITLQYLENNGLHKSKNKKEKFKPKKKYPNFEDLVKDFALFTPEDVENADDKFAVDENIGYLFDNAEKKQDSFKEIMYFSDLNLTQPKKPKYIKNYPVCPNIAIRTLRNTYLDIYENYVKLNAFKKANVPISNSTTKKELKNIEKLLEAVYEEYKAVVHLEKDCLKCSENGSCNLLD